MERAPVQRSDDRLQAEMEEAVRQAREAGALQRIGLPTLFLLALAANQALVALVNPEELPQHILLAAFWAYLARAYESMRQSGATARAALRLSHLNRENLPILTGLLEHEHPRMRRTARMRLMTVLPTLQPGDLARLTSDERTLLYDQLTPGIVMEVPDFGAALLEAIHRDGGDDALPAVLPLARLPDWSPALRRLRARAGEVIMVLERRSALVRQATPNETMRLEPAPESTGAAAPPPDIQQREAPALRLVFLLAVYLIAMPGLAYLAVDFWQRNNILQAAFCGLGLLVAPQLYRWAMLPRHHRAVRELERTRDVRYIGRLAEALAWPDERAVRRIGRAIIPLLHQLKASDTRMLDDRQRDCLHARLRMDRARRDAELQVAILAALEQVGDTRAIPFVMALAEARAVTARQQRVKKAAQECLQALFTTAKRNDPERTLLRSASPPLGPEAGLVVPAGTAETPPERLVRPAN